MKKIYNSPAIETAELHLHTAIMSNIVGGGELTGDPGAPAPKPRPDKPF